MAYHLEDVECGECGVEEVYMDLKDEPSVYKIGARCGGCQHDYGVLSRVQRSEISHIEEVYEQGEDSIKEFLEGSDQ